MVVFIEEDVPDAALFEERLEACKRARLLGEGRGSDALVRGRDPTVDAIQEVRVAGMEQSFNVCGPCG